MLRFLPYTDGMSVVGYKPRNRSGRLEEFFNTPADARTRMKFLIDARAIEDAEIRQRAQGSRNYSTLIEEWEDPTEPTEED